MTIASMAASVASLSMTNNNAKRLTVQGKRMLRILAIQSNSTREIRRRFALTLHQQI